MIGEGSDLRRVEVCPIVEFDARRAKSRPRGSDWSKAPGDDLSGDLSVELQHPQVMSGGSTGLGHVGRHHADHPPRVVDQRCGLDRADAGGAEDALVPSEGRIVSYIVHDRLAALSAGSAANGTVPVHDREVVEEVVVEAGRGHQNQRAVTRVDELDVPELGADQPCRLFRDQGKHGLEIRGVDQQG